MRLTALKCAGIADIENDNHYQYNAGTYPRFLNAMKKLLFPALLSLLSMSAAQAHQVWIEQNGKTATLQFGEFGDNLRETTPGLLDKFVAPSATLVSAKGNRPLALEKTARGFVLAGAAGAGESIVAVDAAYPGWDSQKDGKTIHTIWVPAARFVTGFAAQQPVLDFDIVPAGKPGQFKVFYKGQPAAKVDVSAVIPNGWSKKATSDAQGLVSFDLPWKGSYVLEAHYNDKTPGERDGKSYDAASFVTSLSFVLAGGAPALPAGPAAAPNQ